MEDIDKNNLKKLFDKNELHRLIKALKTENRKKLIDWAAQFEDSIRREYDRQFEKQFKEELSAAINNFIIAIVYTLHFNEKCKFGGKRIDDFMEDLLATIDNFTDGSYSPRRI